MDQIRQIRDCSASFVSNRLDELTNKLIEAGYSRSDKYVALVTKLASRGRDNRLAVNVDFFARRDCALHVFFADEIIDSTVACAVR